SYPGATARDVAESVAAPIEQQLNDHANLDHLESYCTNDGRYVLAVRFMPDTNLQEAQSLVEQRVAVAMPALPDVLKQSGVSVRIKAPVLMLVSLSSPDGRLDPLYLSNYVVVHLRDELARLDGIGEVRLFGQHDYSMRVWLDPEKLATRGLTASDVV